MSAWRPRSRRWRSTRTSAPRAASSSTTSSRSRRARSATPANGGELLARVRELTGIPVRVLSTEEEAYFGYLAAVNSTTLRDGAVLDLGGGSLQLVRVRGRQAVETRLLAARHGPHDRALLRRARRRARSSARRCAPTSSRSFAAVPGAVELRGSVVGIGGTVRNLAAAADAAAGLPSIGVQGAVIEREALDALIKRAGITRASMSARGSRESSPVAPGVILAGAIVIGAAMEAIGTDRLEVTQAGLREGVFFSSYLEPARAAAVRRRPRSRACATSRSSTSRTSSHCTHVAELAGQLLDSLDGSAPAASRPRQRAAAVGCRNASRHRRVGRLRRPPQALALPDPRRRAAGVQPARARADRADGALPPQGDARARRARAAVRARRRAAAADAPVGAAAPRRASRPRPRRRGRAGARCASRASGSSSSWPSTATPALARWGAERQSDLFRKAFGRPLTARLSLSSSCTGR